MKLDVCGGCNAKIGAGSLDKILKNIEIFKRPDILIGFDGKEDASVIEITEDIAIVFTVDFFPPMVEDPYIFGQIAAANALSDCYAMGAEPVSCLNIVCFPEEEDKEVLEEILRGGADKVKEAGATLSGGHSIHDPKIKYGLCVIGKVNPSKIYRNNTPKVGDKLILTKPLGVSLLSSGYSVGEVSVEDFNRAVESMIKLNKYSFEILSKYNLNALTDVTGFGLLGHLSEMLTEDFSAEINSNAVNILKGAKEAAADFLFTAGGQRNRNAFESKVKFLIDNFAMEEVLFDPQTSGGLLCALDYKSAEEALEELRKNNIEATIIGEVVSKREKSIYVR
ncbi:selenophosphate synthase [Anaerosphaera aminiphila DSM 21120]|uniref:Selenide, water dikinase n=1 Tax=Anaerosphaera aminiphila DSM 21120 TaxID=1120995 RepID=A0A1M5Q7B4_9FIRM|nr:selenide, water dikinase SelD [Anaerosphaera aminiphila]SHH09796.1 selenophosphate synthase [Anaerosphaera aminiphila DSM 21120]